MKEVIDMIKLTNLREFTREDIPTALQEYLTDKFHQIIREYALYDMDGMFSVILLAKDESSYFSDKLLEFWELLTFDNAQYIHTVYVPAEDYSEDLYIPHSNENMREIERRCP